MMHVMQNLIAFTYSTGQRGYVPVQSLKTFTLKDNGLSEAMRLQTTMNITDPEAHEIALNKAFGRIMAANRRIQKNGWVFYNQELVNEMVTKNLVTVVSLY